MFNTVKYRLHADLELQFEVQMVSTSTLTILYLNESSPVVFEKISINILKALITFFAYIFSYVH